MTDTQKKVNLDYNKYTCYDCEAENEYNDNDIYDYYDANLGLVFSFTCKSCGLTNPANQNH